MTLYALAERRPVFARGVVVGLNACIDNAEPDETEAVRFLWLGKSPENLTLTVRSAPELLEVLR